MVVRANKTIITCAVTGGLTNPKSTPYLPITPDEIADSALGAAEAGAAIVHVHVRDPHTKGPSTKLELYIDTVDKIRKHNPEVLINLTTGPGAIFFPGKKESMHLGDERSNFFTAEQRVIHIETIKPEICSMDFNVMHHAEFSMRVNFKPVLREMAQRIYAAGVKPEIECFDSGDVRIVQDLQKEGVIEARPFWQFAMGVKYGWDHTTETLTYARSMIPADATWSAFGIGREQMPMLAATWLLGGHVRVGLEDNIYLSKGVLAKSNAELVARGRRIIEDLGGSLATCAEAREILELRPRPLMPLAT